VTPKAILLVVVAALMLNLLHLGFEEFSTTRISITDLLYDEIFSVGGEKRKKNA